MGRETVSRDRSARVNRLALLAVLACVAGSCEPTGSRIVAATPDSVAEGTTETVVLDTQGCAPVFDLDRSSAESDPTATLVLGNDAGMLSARRTLDEQFEADLPPTIAPGAYEIALQLGDGRRAQYTGRLRVQPRSVTIDEVRSSRSSVLLNETGLPLTVLLSNPGQCAVEGLVVAPVFTRAGADLSGDFIVNDPGPISIPAGGHASVDFSVGLAISATAGVVELDARATGGQRTGAVGCSGSVDASGAPSRPRWVLVAPARALLTVVEFTANPRQVAAGGAFHAMSRIRNDATVPLMLASLDLTSSPPGPIVVMPADFGTAPLAPGETGNFSVRAVLPEDATLGQVYVLGASASARDDLGNVYSSAVPSPQDSVTVSH